MPVFRKPIPGERVGQYVANRAMWSALMDMLNAWRRNQIPLKKPHGLKTVPLGVKDTLIATGTVQAMSLEYDPFSSSTPDTELSAQKPIFALSDPVWHSNISNVCVVHRPMLANVPLPVRNTRYVLAPINIYLNTDEFAMIDPDEPTKLKSSTSGIFKVLAFMGSDPDTYAFIDTYQSQTRWRYELTQDSQAPGTSTAKLLRLDGVEFAASISLSDPDSIGSLDKIGHRGYCEQIGNEFHIASGPC